VSLVRIITKEDLRNRNVDHGIIGGDTDRYLLLDFMNTIKYLYYEVERIARMQLPVVFTIDLIVYAGATTAVTASATSNTTKIIHQLFINTLANPEVEDINIRLHGRRTMRN
jgi:hypothetical protein